MSYRSESFQEKAQGRSILQIALDVHMTVNGSLERSYPEQRRDVSLLNEVLSNWQKGHWRTVLFDDAVRHLIEIALTEDALFQKGVSLERDKGEVNGPS